jgi:hypothetical protein
MSRIGFVIALLGFAAVCGAQLPAGPSGRGGPEIGEQDAQGTDADVRHRAADPHAVEIPLYAGAQISEVLNALVAKGFRIKWSPKEVLPTMKIVERPKSTRIDFMLNEILKPWDLRVDHNQMDGGYRVRPITKKPKD